MQHAPALFVADATALDFLNSVATPVDVPVEWLDDGEGLLSWLQQAQLVSEPVLERVRSQFSLAELNQAADRARDLREWFRGFVETRAGAGRSEETGSAQSPARARRFLQSDRDRCRQRRQHSRATSHTQMAFARSAALSDRGDAGALRVRGGLHLRKGVRGPHLHAAFRGSHPKSGEALVQHGDLREPGQAGGSSKQGQGTPLTGIAHRCFSR
jgi:hypothetical protein